MPRGGKRQGTPGKAYANRTDMTSDYANEGSAAAGGMTAPTSAAPMQLPTYPDQTPNLSDPTSRPDEPVTDGILSGEGRGPEAMTGLDPRPQETQALKKWLPLLDPIMNQPDAPESVKVLIRYIRSS
jgi:hypothetical protein